MQTTTKFDLDELAQTGPMAILMPALEKHTEHTSGSELDPAQAFVSAAAWFIGEHDSLLFDEVRGELEALGKLVTDSPTEAATVVQSMGANEIRNAADRITECLDDATAGELAEDVHGIVVARFLVGAVAARYDRAL